MRSWTLIGFYLWKDTWKRWLEHPSSPLARLSVSTLLVLVTAITLVGFRLVEREMRERLNRFGLNTVVVRETVSPESPEFIVHGQGPDRLTLLSTLGKRIRLRQLFARAHSELKRSDLLVFSYSPEAIPALANLLSPKTPVICLSDSLPEVPLMPVVISRRTAAACVRRPPEWLRPLVADGMVLVPQGWCEDEEQLGYLETTVFQRNATAPSLERITEALKAWASLERHTSLQIQSAVPLVHELEILKSRQTRWRGLLATILGTAISLIFGAVAMLEFRQNLFVTALLRSLGAPARFLYYRYWLESTLLANVAAVAGIFFVTAFERTILDTLGFSNRAFGLAPWPGYAFTELGSILIWVTAGAFFSSLPIAAALRQPIGRVLN